MLHENAKKFISLGVDYILIRYGYEVSRQTGSHIRMTLKKGDSKMHVTIPNYNPIRIGTLNAILNDVSIQLEIPKNEILSY